MTDKINNEENIISNRIVNVTFSSKNNENNFFLSPKKRFLSNYENFDLFKEKKNF